MPDLETGIRQWKRSLAIAFGGSGEIVEELESHLREEIDRRLPVSQRATVSRSPLPPSCSKMVAARHLEGRTSSAANEQCDDLHISEL
jgi:hypothetical protein